MKIFAPKKLDQEYQEILLKATQKLARKRPSPLEKGKAHTWACGIIHAIGSNNFLFDSSMSPYLKASEIAEWFGIAKSTSSSKSREVSDLLNLSYFNSEFMLANRVAKNPLIWYLEVNGYMVDVRSMPYEVQEQAFRQGLIPYIPDDVID